MIWLTSDNHFHHEKIIQLEGRPFLSVEEMNETLIDRWNLLIKPKDDAYILGDLTLGSKKENIELFPKLNGKKYLIKGNHDRVTKDWYEHFIWIKDYHELKAFKQTFILFHYPIYSWRKKEKGYIHLHGHTHGGDSHPDFDHALKLNVGVGLNNYYPLELEHIIEIVEGRKKLLGTENILYENNS